MRVSHILQIGTTGLYNHQGASSILCVHDEIEGILNAMFHLEKGVTDIPLLIQDKRLNVIGECIYIPSENDFLGGFLGNTLLVNGAVSTQSLIYAIDTTNSE